MSKVRVVLADDHAVLRSGLKALLEADNDIEVVGESGDGKTCIEQVVALDPDIAILDINMPHCSGLEALETLGATAPRTRILILTMHDDIEYLRKVLALGGAGYVLKHAASEELMSAIRTVQDGGVYLHSDHARTLAMPDTEPETSPPDEPHARYESLSDREAEVLKLIALGYRNTEIADMAFISVKTVETYKSRLMQKLDLHSRAALVRFALDLDLLS
ncbi:Two-component transcriptional response regulator, LuxR family [hydrothermal vent metagenome]|uniref:Two-component transcriptional response regulator, LuxR family n=1 Tax=hydrothermal vent metagenome TaxID=652676 RepID=A0A3B0SQL1_9ZZZZ